MILSIFNKYNISYLLRCQFIKKINIDNFMINYFPKLSNELQIYIYSIIIQKFNYIYRQYKINPKFLKYNDKSLICHFIRDII